VLFDDDALLCLIKSESRILNYKHVVLMNLECDARSTILTLLVVNAFLHKLLFSIVHLRKSSLVFHMKLFQKVIHLFPHKLL
jgi:hypothetical protein